MLAYKQVRQIINRAYQTQADNVVGKMTIARLDEEIARVEGTLTHLDRCGQGGGGFRSRAVGAPTGPQPVNLRRRLAIHMQRTDQFTAGAELFATALVGRARALLSPHGLQLIETPGPGLVGDAVPWPDGIVKTQLPPERFAARKAAISASLGDPAVLRVILCAFDPIDRIHGITDGGDLPGCFGKEHAEVRPDQHDFCGIPIRARCCTS